MNEQYLRTIENVTANFFFWQGLRWVPMGVAMMAWAIAPQLSPPAKHAWA